MEQVQQYDPPPNPTKQTDSRSTGYGMASSWELDALDPAVLRDLIQDTITEYVDQETFDAAVEHEQQGEDRISLITDRWADLEANWDDVLAIIDGDDD